MMTASKVRVLVTLRPEILDAPGQTVKSSLQALGFADVTSVRVGKVIEIEMSVPLTAQKKQDIEKMARDLLANPIIEDFKVEAI